MGTFKLFVFGALTMVGHCQSLDGNYTDYTLATDDVPLIEFHSNGKLEISFTDGSKDVITMEHSFPEYRKHVDEDRIANEKMCFYNGYLPNEPEVYVALNGCPGSSNFDIMFMSRRAKGLMHQVRDGVAARLEQTNRGDKAAGYVQVENVMERARNITEDRMLPAPFTLKVHLVADGSYVRKFGNSFRDEAMSTMNLVKGLYKLPALSRATKIDIEVVAIDSTPITFDATADQSHIAKSEIRKLADKGANAYGFFGIGDRTFPTLGRSSLATACSSWFEKREDSSFLALAVVASPMGSAITVAHELAHTIGIRHDFLGTYHPGHPKTPRYSLSRKLCTDIKGVMDYDQEGEPLWSDCSADDIRRYYYYQIEKYGLFCLDFQ